MKVSELFEEQSIGTLSVSPSGDGFVVNASSKTGPIVGAVFHVWKALSSKKGVVTKMKSGETVDSNMAIRLLDTRPQGLVFFGVDESTVKAAVDAAIAKVQKEVKSNEKYKADAPKRKAEASKYQAEKRKKDLAEYEKKYGKGTWGRVTYKQEGGDDGYAYVVRVDGRAKWNGLTQREAMHYKEREVDALAKAAGLGKYAEVKEGVDDKSAKLATLKRRLRELTTDYHNMGYTFSEAERKLRVQQIKDEMAELEAK